MTSASSWLSSSLKIFQCSFCSSVKWGDVERGREEEAMEGRGEEGSCALAGSERGGTTSLASAEAPGARVKEGSARGGLLPGSSELEGPASCIDL